MAGEESNEFGEGQGGRAAEIDAVLRDLNACVQRINGLIPRVYAVIDRRTAAARPQTRPRVVYGGGASAFAPHERPATELRVGAASRPLIVATDLALAGYSKDQIRARLRPWGDAGAARALDELFE